MKEKNLGDCSEAREILPRLAALDTVFLLDKTQGAINLVSTEKLARGAYALVQGYRDVHKVEDWKRSGQKTWKTKVDAEAIKRYDPDKMTAFGEPQYVSRQVEEEVRSEMDRDAQLIKARTKLAQQQAADAKG